MGAAYGKKKAYSIEHQQPPPQKKRQTAGGKNNKNNNRAGRQTDTQQPLPQPDYNEDQNNEDLTIKPKKLLNPVRASISHQELHRELMTKRVGGCMEVKPELQRVLEHRRRDQLIRNKKEEEEERRKISPLEEELRRRHRKLEEEERQKERMKEESSRAPEFMKVKENLRRTSVQGRDEKMV